MNFFATILRKQVERAVKSYPDHPGRPGKRGGSLPRRFVGITSARPDNLNPENIARQAKDFRDKLKAIPGVQRVKVRTGYGAWQGGSEPTWVVSYDGNGEAKKLVAQTGKQYNQDGVLYFSKVKETEYSEPSEAHELSFDHSFTDEERGAVDELMGALGFGGWTWMGDGRKSVIRAVAVPQWGSTSEELRERVGRLKSELDKIGFGHKHGVIGGLYVETFNNTGMGPRTYDDIIQ